MLWGWLGQDLAADELAGVQRVRSALNGSLGESLDTLLTPEEIAAIDSRCEMIASEARFPPPRGEMPAIPWPPF